MHRRRAFTLVELLVVIGIIALLIAVLLPALNRAREASYSVKCLSNVRQITLAFMMYTLDNKGKFPTSARGSTGSAPNYLAEDWIYWQPGRVPVTSTDPLGTNVTESRIVKYLGHFKQEVFICPTDELEAHKSQFHGVPYPYSYSMCLYYNSESLGMNPSVTTKNYYPSLRISNVRNASEKVLIIEEDEQTGNTGINDGEWLPGNLDASGMWYSTGDLLSVRHQRHQKVLPDTATAANPIPNPGLHGNVGFVDGHAAFVTREYAHNIMHVQPLYPTLEP